MKLSKLKIGESAIVTKLDFFGVKLKEFNEIGLTKGVKLRLIRKASFDGPYELFLRGFHLAIRKIDAQKIEVEIVNG